MYRNGIGYDTHRLEKGLKFTLGGVDIPYDYGLKGHSDADVLIHAVMDALLGAAGKPDIGHLFPDTDPSYKGISSLSLLKKVCKSVDVRFDIVNIDTVIICQNPKLSPFIPEMSRKISEATSCAFVNVKATTTEGMNDEGKGLCVSAQAVVLLKEQSL